MKKNCLKCGAPFEAKRESKKYCSDNCRQMAYYIRNGIISSGVLLKEQEPDNTTRPVAVKKDSAPIVKQVAVKREEVSNDQLNGPEVFSLDNKRIESFANKILLLIEHKIDCAIERALKHKIENVKPNVISDVKQTDVKTQEHFTISEDEPEEKVSVEPTSVIQKDHPSIEATSDSLEESNAEDMNAEPAELITEEITAIEETGIEQADEEKEDQPEEISETVPFDNQSEQEETGQDQQTEQVLHNKEETVSVEPHNENPIQEIIPPVKENTATVKSKAIVIEADNFDQLTEIMKNMKIPVGENKSELAGDEKVQESIVKQDNIKEPDIKQATVKREANFTETPALDHEPEHKQERRFRSSIPKFLRTIIRATKKSNMARVFRDPTAFAYGSNMEKIKWITERFLCLIENLLRLSVLSSIPAQDLDTIANAFDELAASKRFEEVQGLAYTSSYFTYLDVIKELAGQLKTLAEENAKYNRIPFRLSRERRAQLIAMRWEIGSFVSYKRFSELEFTDREENDIQSSDNQGDVLKGYTCIFKTRRNKKYAYKTRR